MKKNIIDFIEAIISIWKNHKEELLEPSNVEAKRNKMWTGRVQERCHKTKQNHHRNEVEIERNKRKTNTAEDTENNHENKGGVKIIREKIIGRDDKAVMIFIIEVLKIFK